MRICGPSFSLDSLRLKRPAALAQDFCGPAPLGKMAYTAVHGARLSSVPSGDRSATLPLMVLQCAAISSEHTAALITTRGQSQETGSLSRVTCRCGSPCQRVSFGSCLSRLWFYQSSLPRRCPWPRTYEGRPRWGRAASHLLSRELWRECAGMRSSTLVAHRSGRLSMVLGPDFSP